MDFMTDKFEECEQERQEKDKTVDSMKSDMVNMNKKIEKLERIADGQEQYPHRKCLLPHSIAEGKRENTNDLVLETFNKKMHVELTPSDLDRAHCIGQNKQ